MGRAKVRVFSRRSLIEKTRIRKQASSYDICGGQGGT